MPTTLKICLIGPTFGYSNYLHNWLRQEEWCPEVHANLLSEVILRPHQLDCLFT